MLCNERTWIESETGAVAVRRLLWLSAMRAALIAALCVGVCVSARAERTGDAARAAYREGTALYRAGRYDAAIAAFSRGYSIAPQPLFLYDIAQAARLANQPAKAITYYQLYLARNPRAPDGRRILALIDRLRRDAEPPPEPERPADPEPASVTEAAPPPAPAPPPVELQPARAVVTTPAAVASLLVTTEPPPPRRRLRGWHWALIGGSCAVAAAAAVTLAVIYTRPGAPATDLGNVRVAP
jgi:tetratricopeptide (TPR) repeat protein